MKSRYFFVYYGIVLFILFNVQNNAQLPDSAGNVNGSTHCFNFPEFQNFFPAPLPHKVQKLKKNLIAFVKKINEILLLSKKNPYFYLRNRLQQNKRV